MIAAREQRVRFVALVGSHLVLGLAMAAIPSLLPRVRIPDELELFFLSLIISEVLLLGAWAGFAPVGWWLRLAGAVTGVAWLGGISLLAAGEKQINSFLEVAGMLSICTAVIAAGCLVCRRFVARLVQRSHWPVPSVSQELQFSVRSLIGLTALVAGLLALGRMLAPFKGWNFAVAAVIFSILLIVAAAMVLWAGLGPGRVSVRAPAMLLGMTALGFLPPYYNGGPPKYWIWALMTFVTGLYAAASLLVVRGCGYRLVNLVDWRASTDSTHAPAGAGPAADESCKTPGAV